MYGKAMPEHMGEAPLWRALGLFDRVGILGRNDVVGFASPLQTVASVVHG